MEEMLNRIIRQAEKNLEMAFNYSQNIINNNSKTEILNAELCYGKYFAYMEMLWELDVETYVELGSKHFTKRESILDAIEKIY